MLNLFSLPPCDSQGAKDGRHPGQLPGEDDPVDLQTKASQRARQRSPVPLSVGDSGKEDGRRPPRGRHRWSQREVRHPSLLRVGLWWRLLIRRDWRPGEAGGNSPTDYSYHALVFMTCICLCKTCKESIAEKLWRQENLLVITLQ